MQEQPRRSLRFEPLEPKHLMAGNVSVTLTGVNLLVSGDDAANQIAITAGDAPDTLVVRGLQGTTVTLAGSTTPAPATGLVVPNVRGHVRVETGGGNDEVSVTGLELRRRLSLQTGDGNDQVALQDVSVGGLLSIAAGAGNDTVRLGPQNAPAGPLQSYADASVKSALAIDVLLGDGEDTATLASTAARGAVVVAGGMGADALGFDSVRAAVLAAIGGEGDGADTIQVAHARALAGVFATGGGADEVEIADSAFTSLTVALGGGNDRASLEGTSAKLSVLAGGEGAGDSLVDAGANSLGRRIVRGFELPEGVNTPLESLWSEGGIFARIVARLFR